MKGMVVASALLALVVLVGACSSGAAASGGVFTISCDEFQANNHISKSIQVNQGETFSFTLCSNPTTGYSWQQAKVSDAAVLSDQGSKANAPNVSQAGTAGSQTFTLKALKKGTSTVSIDYSRPWEGGEKGTWTLTLTVEVE
jgi:predicted secreted protein